MMAFSPAVSWLILGTWLVVAIIVGLLIGRIVEQQYREDK